MFKCLFVQFNKHNICIIEITLMSQRFIYFYAEKKLNLLQISDCGGNIWEDLTMPASDIASVLSQVILCLNEAV